jgi:DNA replication ATP-dependent helicase Dna2
LKFKKGDPKESLIEFSISTNESKMRQGDICLIYDKSEPISNQQVFKGTIKTIDKNSVEVVFKNPDSIKFLSNDKQWFLEADYMDLNIRKNIYALIDFAASDKRTQKLILGLEQPSFTKGKLSKKISSINNKKLTQKQKEAIRNAINADDYYLIQGPPGTGKTTLLAYLIKALIADGSERLLVTAFTNRAVDEIIKKFINETNMTDSIVRLGNNNITTEYPEYMIKNLIKDVPDSEVLTYLKKKKVFFGTINTAAYNDIFQCIKFTTSIVDEASQIVEPEALSVILNTKKFILVGDEKQLPSVVPLISSDSSIEQITTDIKDLNEIGITRLDSSLFERLVTTAKNNNWNSCTLLDTQFRMNDNLFQFSNINFYSSELHSGKNNRNIQTEFDDGKNFINNNPIEFFDITASGCEKNKNKNEADTLVRLLEEYYKQNTRKKLGYTLGVIAPFRAQVSYILQELHARNIEDVKVDTVERFQGGEKDIIFISFTVYSDSQISQIQSLQSFGSTVVDRKLNVAVTRAKRKLVMFGNADLLGKDSIFNKLLSYCKEQKSFHCPAYNS